MAHTDAPPPGPDFAAGVALTDVPATGVLAGHVAGEAVLLARLDGGFTAVSGSCTHYGAPLAEGLVVGEEIRCPWHHACFSLRSGAALRAPAFASLACWQVDVVGDRVFVRGKTTPPRPPAPRPRRPRERIVIVGGGAAGYAAAERLRELGHAGSLTMLSADTSAPYDRPNLSKDYLAGTAPEEWIPLQGDAFYAERAIDLRLDSEVVGIDVAARELRTRNGERHAYDALLFATGAEPRRLNLPGLDGPRVFTLRTLADARAVIAASTEARKVVLIGAGFIGLEAAGALRARGLEVHVVAPGKVPMERALGAELGGFIAALHAAQGVQFHMGATPTGFDGSTLTLDDGSAMAADLVVVGTGVTPRTALAAMAGLAIDDGILVDETLQTSAPDHYAAGDVARYPFAGDTARVEHWVHAQRQGQVAAANLLGAGQRYGEVPFFWTHHQGVDLRYCGHAGRWDDVLIDGDLTSRDFTARYFRGGRLVAAASVGRDRENLTIEAQLRGDI